MRGAHYMHMRIGRLLLMLPLLFAAAVAAAHPAVSIVADRRGNIFYSDLEQVWRIAPDGTRSIAVPHVHTHELALDAGDNLYGEHLWYNGERLNTWGHSVWRRSPDGKITTVIPPSPGFLTTWSLVRDAAGNMYSADREHNAILRRTPAGAVSVLARASFRDIRWLTATPGGTVFLIDGTDAVRITPDGKVTRLARNLTRPNRLKMQFEERHLVQGIWTDARGNLYAAVSGEGVVKRIDPAGHVAPVASSPFPWKPSGGTITRDGTLWLLEYSPTNQQRVRRVGRVGG